MSEYWKHYWNKKSDKTTEVLEFYDGYTAYDTLRVKVIANQLIEHLNITKETEVLEVCCGALSLGQYLINECKYTGTDFSNTLIEQYKATDKATDKAADKVELYCAEASNMPMIPDKSKDVVFIWSAHQYFPDLKYAADVMTECERIARKVILFGDLRTDVDQKKYYPVYTTYSPSFFYYNGYTLTDMPEPLYGGSFNVIKYL